MKNIYFLLILLFITTQLFAQTDRYNGLIVKIQNDSESLRENDLIDLKLDTICLESMFDCFPCSPRTLIDLCIYSKDYKSLKILLNKGANPDFTDNSGLTALHHAAQLNDTIAAKILLEYNANIESVFKGEYDITPFLISAKWSNPEMTLFLIKHGANIYKLNRDGLNAMELNKLCCGDGADINPDSKMRTQKILKINGIK